MQTFLHVGCGPKHKDQTTAGFNSTSWLEVRLDIDPAVNPDVVGTMTDMSAMADESVDAIFSSHNIEHLYPHEVPLAMKEFLRVLKPDGFLIITCPDLQSVCQLIAEDKLTETAYTAPAGPIAPIDILYGHRPQLAAGNHFMAHKCGFTRKVLTGTLQASGFAVVAGKARGRAPFFDLWSVASKGPRTEDAIREIAAAHFQKEEGEPLIAENGELGAPSTKALAFLKVFQEGLLTTQGVLKQFENAGVLIEKTLTLQEGKETCLIGGFRVIDADKVKALPDETLARWARNGMLALIHGHWASLRHLKKVAIASGRPASTN